MQLLWTQCSREVWVASSSFDKKQFIVFANKCPWPGRTASWACDTTALQRALPLHVLSVPRRQVPPAPGWARCCAGHSSSRDGCAQLIPQVRRKGGCQGPAERSVPAPAIRTGSVAGTAQHVWRAGASPQSGHHHCSLWQTQCRSAAAYSAQLLSKGPF